MSGMPKFSLSFTKTIEKKNLQPSAIRNDAPQEVKEATEILESIEANVMKTDAKVEETELVIPMVMTDRLSILRKVAEKKLEKEAKSASNGEQTSKVALEDGKCKPSDAVADQPLSLEEQAEAAIIEESKRKLENWTERGAESNLTILQTEQKAIEVPSASKESSLDDYEEVDISVFGAALLRGMGWKKSEGIGRVNKQVIDIIDPSSKTFGLAGKADIDGKKPGQDSLGNQEEALILKKGSYVLIHSGRHRSTYGVVESLDEDHLLVKAAVTQEVIREVELNVKAVSQKEYKDSSRVINKDMYDKFKEEEARRTKKGKSKSENSDSNSEQESKKKEIKKEKWKSEKSDLDRESMSKPTSTEKSNSESVRHLSSPLNYPRKKEEKEDVKKEGDEYKAETERKQEKLSEKSRNVEKNRDVYDKYSRDKHIKDDPYNKFDDRYDRKKGNDDVYKKVDDDKYNKSSHHDNYSGKTKIYNSKYGSRHNDDNGDKYKERNKSTNFDSLQMKRKVELDSDSVQHKKGKTLQPQMPAIPWVRENLRVRLINKDYKGGRYHKEKVIVKFVETAESCECVTDDGRILQEVHPDWLETVIPKVDPKIVLIVKGNQKGQRGRILQLHKDQEKASIQLFDDETIILKLHYDDICEYVSRY